MALKNSIRDMSTLGRVLLAKFQRKRFPISVTFIITYRCNFRCDYCNVFNCEEEEMNTGAIFAMIDELCAMGMRRFGINGGEPLLREDIAEIIDYARDKGLFVTLFTNGSLVAQRIDRIRNLNVLLMSLDGPKDIHDAQRFSGSFDKVIESLVAARRAGLNVWTNTVITRHNLDCLDFILDNARRFGIKTTYQPVLYYPHSSEEREIKDLLPDSLSYRKYIDRLIREKRKGGPILHSLSYLEYIKNPDWRTNQRLCWAGRLYCAITPSGNVAPCYPIFRDRLWPNGVKLGFSNALNKLGSFSCNGCYCILVENDFTFSLKPEVVYNTFTQILA